MFEKSSEDDFICLTDIVRLRTDDARAADIIKNWLRTRSTIEFLGTWESIYNPNFKVVEFDHFRREAGLPTFTMSVNNWIENTGAIGIVAKAGRYGGTYAHKDIAFEFCSAISPVFKLLLIKEYQRLKAEEQNPLLGEWNVKRVLSKVNYTIHTDAVKEYIVPQYDEKDQTFAYASEADLLNLALWGCTAAQWRSANPELAGKGLNLRECGSINELVVISNMESMNAELIKQGLDRKTRYDFLCRMASEQLAHLNDIDAQKQFRKLEAGDGQKLLK